MTLIAGLETPTHNLVAFDSMILGTGTAGVYMDSQTKCLRVGALVVVGAGAVAGVQDAFRNILAGDPNRWETAATVLEVSALVSGLIEDLDPETASESEIIIGNPFGVFHAELDEGSVVRNTGGPVAGGVGSTYLMGAYAALIHAGSLPDAATFLDACCVVSEVCGGVRGPIESLRIERARS